MAYLSGPRVLVTRAPGQGSELAEALRALGAEPVLIPAIALAPPTSFEGLDDALARLPEFDWLLFTSANAVEAFGSRQATLTEADPHRVSQAVQPPPGAKGRGGRPVPRIAAIGPATARALGLIGMAADLLPPQAVAESLAAALLPHVCRSAGEPAHFLLVRAEDAREHLPQTLRAAGAEVTVAPAYRTIIPTSSVELIKALLKVTARGPSQAPNPASDTTPPSELMRPIEAITFTSSSTARNLLALFEAAGVPLPPDALRISIGPITSRTLLDLGMPAHAEAREATVAALAEATLAALAVRW